MTDEQKPTPTPGADALAQEVADLLARRAGLPVLPAPEAAPAVAEAPEPFKAAVASPFLSKRMAALIAALGVVASRRFGLDPETTELLLQVAEAVLFGGALSHVLMRPKGKA